MKDPVKKKMPMLSLLRAHLRRVHPADTPGHCDAETLAAFTESTLERTERNRVAHHLSDCQDCREVLALAADAVIIPSGRDGPSKPRFFVKEHFVKAFYIQGLYAAAALASLCMAVAIFHHSKTVSPGPQQPQPAASTNAPAALSSVRPHTFVPHLTDAQVTSPTLAVPTPLWRVRSSHYPATLEISYNSGRTWALIPTPDFHPKSVAAEGSSVWVADAKGTVLESADLGLHWTRLPRTLHPSSRR